MIDSSRLSRGPTRLSVNVDEKSLLKEVVIKMCEVGFKVTETEIKTRTKDVMYRFSSFLTNNSITVEKLKADQKAFFSFLAIAGCTKLNFKFNEQSLRNIGLPHYVKQSASILDCLVSQIYALKDTDILIGEIDCFELLPDTVHFEEVPNFNWKLVQSYLQSYSEFMGQQNVDLHKILLESDDQSKSYDNFMRKTSIVYVKELTESKKVKYNEQKIAFNKKKQKLLTVKENKQILNDLQSIDLSQFEAKSLEEAAKEKKEQFESLKAEMIATKQELDEYKSNIDRFSSIQKELLTILEPFDIDDNHFDIETVREKILKYCNLREESNRDYSQKKTAINSTMNVLREKAKKIRESLDIQSNKDAEVDTLLSNLDNKLAISDISFKGIEKFVQTYAKLEADVINTAQTLELSHKKLTNELEDLKAFVGKEMTY